MEVSSQKAAVPCCPLAAGEPATPRLGRKHRCVTAPDAMGRESGQASAGGSGPVGVGGVRGVGLQVPGLGAPGWLRSPAGVLEGTAGPSLSSYSLRGPLQAGVSLLWLRTPTAQASFQSSESQAEGLASQGPPPHSHAQTRGRGCPVATPCQSLCGAPLGPPLS